MMQIVRSVFLSIIASLAATYLVRLLTSSTGGPPDTTPASTGGQAPPVIVVIVPVVVGNSNNRIGWISEGASPSPWAWRRKRR